MPEALPRLVYEINTAQWLDALRQRGGAMIDLGAVPDTVWEAIADLGADAVWLMGVWQRSASAAAVLRHHPAFARDRLAMPGLIDDDLIGSAYAVGAWRVDPRFGGDAGLAAARQALRRRGMRLILDWIPNHVAADHPWVVEHPEWCIAGDAADLAVEPEAFALVDGRILAHGRDPFFPPWPDTVQLDTTHPGLRRAAADALLRIADRCDGVRCDMAMLPLNDVMARTWPERTWRQRAERGSASPDSGYWPTVLGPVRERHPGFLRLAEAYWDRESELVAQGFDACYDKGLYDVLRTGDADAIRSRLMTLPGEQTVRFLENHDEERATSGFPPERLRAAAVAQATLPGTWLFHQGQEHGHRVHAPVTLGRGAREPDQPDLRDRWRSLIHLRRRPAMRGDWQLAVTNGWPDNPTHRQLLAWIWTSTTERLLVVINWSDAPSQARIRLPWPDLAARPVLFEDPTQDASYLRDGDELFLNGLYVDLAPWAWHVLVTRIAGDADAARAKERAFREA